MKKQYRQIAADLETAFESIEEDPKLGVVIPRDYAVRKLRVASSDLQRGKSGGFRLLYKLDETDENTFLVYILFVYAKNERIDVSLKELQTLVHALENE